MKVKLMAPNDIPSKEMLSAIRKRLFKVYPGLEDGYESVGLKMISYDQWRGEMLYHFPKAKGGAYTTSILVKAKKEFSGDWNVYIEHGPDD